MKQKKLNLKCLSVFFFLMFLTCIVHAQKRTITGIVTYNADSTAIPGVTVIVKGTSIGTITDLDGNYTLEAEDGSLLQYSFIGYTTQEVVVNQQSEINVKLVEATTNLGEVVVVGYGTMKRSDVTGAISSIDSEDMEGMPVTGLDQAIQGKAAGVMVTNNTGAPGGGVSIRIRGTGSISGNNEPLYIIDGIPITNTQTTNPQTGAQGDRINGMSNINPDDIESIEILKDAAACSIYGSRAANGVVLITTKRGKNGKSIIEFDSYYGISTFTNQIDLLNSRDYQQLTSEGLYGFRITDKTDPRFITDEEVKKYDTNWQDEIFRTAPTYSVSLSVRGGNEKTQYMISGSYYDFQGILINTGFNRKSFRTNVDSRINDRLKIGSSMAISYSAGQRQRNSSTGVRADDNKQTGGPIIASALVASPAMPVYNEDGTYAMDRRNSTLMNPVAMANEQNLNFGTIRCIGNVYAEVDIIENLKFKTSLGTDLRSQKERFFFPPIYYPSGDKMPGTARASENDFTELLWINTNVLNYSFTIADKHEFNVLGGIEFQESSARMLFAEVTGYSMDKVEAFSAGTNRETTSNQLEEWGLESYFSRLSYSYQSKYMIQLNARYDGSSRFGPNKKYGFFPSASVGWNVSKEEFMKKFTKIDDLKLRLSYGITGNQEVGNYGWRGSFLVGSSDGSVLNYLGQLGGIAGNISSLDYSWEQHKMTNFGLDFSMFNFRINMSLEYYNRISEKLLLPVELPITTGFSSAISNAGTLTNEGLEFSINTHNLTGKLKWQTSFNIATNKTTVNKLVSDSVRTQTHMIREGGTISFYTYEREEMVDSVTGYVVLKDQNGDGSIAYGGGPLDKTITGSPLPKFYGGITNTFSYAGFDLSFFLQFVYGNKIYNAMRQTLEDLQLASGLTVGLNTTQNAFDNRYIRRDTEDDEGNIVYGKNIHTEYPATNWAGKSTDQREGHDGWIEDGSYIRLKTLSIGYNLPKSILQKVKIESLRLYFTSNNLLTWTNYSGFDPEVSSVTGKDLSANMSIGMDNGSYPQAKTYTFGVKATF